MDIGYIDGLIMPIITAACLCIGYVMKKWLPTDDKWIPTALLIIGALSGLLLFGVDYEGVVKGMVSGVASVGLHQVFKQQLKLPMGDDEYYAMGQYSTIAQTDEEIVDAEENADFESEVEEDE